MFHQLSLKDMFNNHIKMLLQHSNNMILMEITNKDISKVGMVNRLKGLPVDSLVKELQDNTVDSQDTMVVVVVVVATND